MAGLIVIGGSMGAIAALKAITRRLPQDFPIPILLVLHRSADSRPGILPSLARDSGLPFQEIDDKAVIEPGHIALAPADYHSLVDIGAYALSTCPPVRYARPSIDIAVDSAARAYGAQLVVVILSGSNDDGARGAAAAAARGASLIVQEPASAERPAMPEAALSLAQNAKVLTPPDIGGFLCDLPGLGGKQPRARGLP